MAHKGGRRGGQKSNQVVLKNVNLQPTDSMIYRNPLERQVYTVTRTGDVLGVLQGNGISDTFVALSVAFNMVADYTSLAAVFDQYRIDCVEIRFQQRQAGMISATTGFATSLISVIDYDDANTPASFGELENYNNAIESAVTMYPQKRTFAPHVAGTVWNTGAASGYMNLTSPWLDAASPAVPHYGVKAGLRATSALVVIDAYVRLRISFRSSR